MQSDFHDHAERQRLFNMSVYERKLRSIGYRAIGGIDEAGRGSLAGPVVAAACILSEDTLIPLLNDSKKLKAKQRESIFLALDRDPSVSFGIGIVSAQRIDEINILQATFEAMRLAVDNLKMAADFLLVDGNQLPKFSLPAEALVKGDSLSVSIAAASILAKETRDRLMCEMAKSWPGYGFEKHKGYGTAAHLEAIRQYGRCPLHRRSFHFQDDFAMVVQCS